MILFYTWRVKYSLNGQLNRLKKMYSDFTSLKIMNLIFDSLKTYSYLRPIISSIKKSSNQSLRFLHIAVVIALKTNLKQSRLKLKASDISGGLQSSFYDCDHLK